MPNKHPRMERERRTVSAMISLYCRGNHQVKGMCPECAAIHEYAMERLGKCPFQEGKTVCALCHVHCYHQQMREKIRRVMRYAGPRMIHRHPLLAVYHLIDRRRKQPVKK